MVLISQFSLFLVLGLVAVYTFNYSRYSWRQGNAKGAIGLFLLAAATLALPGLMILRQF